MKRKPYTFRLDPEVLPLGIKCTWGKMSVQEHNRRIRAAVQRLWKNSAEFSLLKFGEGGQSQRDAIMALAMKQIPARRLPSPYVGHYGLEVPRRFKNRASRILFGK